ncbi:MAG: DUF4389 domain-containing protein [Candidatus Nanoarchaeia archaeon]|jgi:hypothetical protein
MKPERKEAFMRIVVLFVSGIILGIWKGLIQILVVVNWLIVLFTAKRNAELANFSEYWNTEIYKFLKYMTFVTNKRPFPFSDLERFAKFGK